MPYRRKFKSIKSLYIASVLRSLMQNFKAQGEKDLNNSRGVLDFNVFKKALVILNESDTDYRKLNFIRLTMLKEQ